MTNQYGGMDMRDFFIYLGTLDVLWTAVFRAVIATIVGGIVGMERGRQGRAAGMRTHILVCLGATLTAMTGMYAVEVLGFNSDPLRVSAQVISGIGFLGVGTILIKGRFQITGLTTAAGLWTVATVGLALGIGFYEGAIITFVLAVLATTIMARLEYKITRRNTRFGIYVEIKSDSAVRDMIEHLSTEFPTTDIQVTPPRSSTPGNVGIEANVHTTAKNFASLTPKTMVSALEELEYVVFAIESI